MDVSLYLKRYVYHAWSQCFESCGYDGICALQLKEENTHTMAFTQNISFNSSYNRYYTLQIKNS